MSRPTQKINLSDCIVEIVTFLTWGEKEDIQAAFISGAKISDIKADKNSIDFDPSVFSEARYKLLEIAIKQVAHTDGREPHSYTKEWMRNLSVDDGDTLFDAVELLNKKKS